MYTNLSLRNRLFNGMGAQAFGQAVQIIIRLGEVPLFLAFWGAQRYGEWLMVAAIPIYLSIGDGGFTTTSCRDITMRSSSGDKNGALAVYQSTWVLLLFLSLTIGLITTIIMRFVPLRQWLNFSSMTGQETSIVFLILVIHILLGFQGGLLNAGFWATNRYPQSMFLGSFTRFLEFCLMALAMLMGGGPIQAAASYLLGRIIGTVIIWGAQRKVCPWLTFGFRYASLAEVRRLIAPSFASLAFPVGNGLNIQAIRLIIGIVLGPSAVAVYVPLRTLSNFVVQPRQVVNQLAEPEMAMAFGDGNKNLFNKLFEQSVRISFWSCLLVAIILIPVSYLIFPIWTTGEIAINWPTFIFLILAAVVNSIWYAALMVSYSTNRHGKIAIYYLLIYGLAVLVMSYFAALIFGITGPAIIIFIVEIIMTYLVTKQALGLTELSSRRFIANISKPPIKEIVDGLSFIYMKLTFK